MSIVISDNFFDSDSHRIIFEFCQTAKYEVGETDMPGGPATGKVSNIFPDSSYYSSFDLAIRKDFKQVRDKNLFRMYINYFDPGENPYFHLDGDKGQDAKTFLYYPNLSWDINDGGETQFLVNKDFSRNHWPYVSPYLEKKHTPETEDEIVGILPKPNRLIMFDAEIWHRATSFRDKPRYTIAVKYI